MHCRSRHERARFRQRLERLVVLAVALLSCAVARPAAAAGFDVEASVVGNYTGIGAPVGFEEASGSEPATASASATQPIDQSSESEGVLYQNSGTIETSANAALGQLGAFATATLSSTETPFQQDGTGVGGHVTANATASFQDLLTVTGPQAPDTPVPLTIHVQLDATTASTVAQACDGEEPYSPTGAVLVVDFAAQPTLSVRRGTCDDTGPAASATIETTIGALFSVTALLTASIDFATDSDVLANNMHTATTDAAQTGYVYVTSSESGVGVSAESGADYSVPEADSLMGSSASILALAVLRRAQRRERGPCGTRGAGRTGESCG